MAIPALDSIQGQPVRTINNGDVVSKLCDGTTVSQLLGIDSSGRITIRLDDGAGNAVTSQVNGSQRALDVGINVAGVQIDPRAIRALTSADVVSVVQSTSPWVVKDLADGSVAAGTAGTFSMLTGGVYNTTAPTLTNGQQAATQLTAAGALIIRPILYSTDSITTRLQDGSGNAITSTTVSAKQALDVNVASPLPAGTNNIGSVNQGTSPWVTSDLADGSVAAGTAATKSMLGGAVYNSTAPALTTGQQVALQCDSAGNLKVTVASTTPGTPINNYFTSATAVVYGASDTHLYTITASKTFNGKKFFASAPGRIRIDVQISANGSTFTTAFTAYNSTSTPVITIDMDEFYIPEAGSGAAIQIIRYNEEPGSSFGISSTICGTEN